MEGLELDTDFQLCAAVTSLNYLVFLVGRISPKSLISKPVLQGLQ
jgi:hypothetical protein